MCESDKDWKKLIENISIAVGFHIMDTKYAIIQWNIEEGSFSEIAAIGFFSLIGEFFFHKKAKI